MTGLRFRLDFSEGRRTPNLASLTVFVGVQAVWPVADAPDIFLEIPADDLLSHLVEFWAPLTLRQTYPVPVAATRPIELRAAAERRWDAEPAETAEREDAALCDFEEAHDISHAFSGYFDLSPLFLLRRGDKMIVDTRAGFRVVDYDDAVGEMTRIGDEIAQRLSESDRWSELIGLWHQREAKDPIALLAWATGLTRRFVERLTHDGLLSKPASFTEIANDNDELRIAARMAGALPAEQIAEILSLVAQFPKLSAPELDALARAVSHFIAERYADRRAHEQGEIAARWVRERLGLGVYEACDIAVELERLGVRLDFRSVEPAALRALAIDGQRHGPVAFINMRGPLRSSSDGPRKNWSVRVDLAHELAHLLLDRGHALGAVEVLNSRMPAEIEQRAKSFAGELLAPIEGVAAVWREAGSPRTFAPLQSLTLDLRKTFGVTKAVATWKLQHATERVDVDISRLLDQIEPMR